MDNIVSSETSRAITPCHFFGYFNFLYQDNATFSPDNYFLLPSALLVQLLIFSRSIAQNSFQIRKNCECCPMSLILKDGNDC